MKVVHTIKEVKEAVNTWKKNGETVGFVPTMGYLHEGHGSLIERARKDNDKVVVGLSGGPDSMCLLDILLSLNKKIEIICAHINHNIRKESTEEEKFVKDYCSKRKVIYETTTFDKKSPNKDYTEQELREKRYIFFEKIIKKHHAKYLFTAHHGDDLIETILLRIVRGSTLKGYSGFDKCTDNGSYKVVRPLVFLVEYG